MIREMPPHLRELPLGVGGQGQGPPMGVMGYPPGQLLPGLGPDPTRLSPRPPRSVTVMMGIYDAPYLSRV